ncbi:PREDICTED: uncharacterized protein LOC109114186, partial [Nelumbo nucifera]|uniref:Uncharacterized protein LOC109114186 n=1 Tax=Nelumbo nucifera TaxID=4432 RepID=A0A1U8PZK5_NELNU
MASSPSHVSCLISDLSQSFSLKGLGSLHYFLGVEANEDAIGLFLYQDKYILDLLLKTNLAAAKPVSSPMATTSQPSKFQGVPWSDPTQYRSIVGALQYVTLIRPDVAFDINKACKFSHAPTEEHWAIVKIILRCLIGIVNYGLYFSIQSSGLLVAFFDVDWAVYPDDHYSIGGYGIFLGSQLVSRSAKKHLTIACSSMEAEFWAMANSTIELMWLQSLLFDQGVVGATYL